MFIIRVKSEVKREYINGCRYNERLNSETVYSKPSPSGHTTGNCRPGQTFKKPKYLSVFDRVSDREERGRGEGAFCSCLDDVKCLGGGLYHLYHEF